VLQTVQTPRTLRRLVAHADFPSQLEKPALSTRFWHGFADMHLVKDAEVVVRAADGVWLDTTDGRRLLDATGALWYCAVGYGRRTIAEAVAEQLSTVAAYSSFGAYTTETTLRLADRLSALAPFDDAKVFLGSGGSDAIDTAAKLVRRYWDVSGRPEKRIIVSREHGYHGMHAWGTSLAGIPANKAGYGGAFIDEVITVGVDDTETLGALFEERGREIAAFIGEPVIGAGGVYPPEPSYWPEIERLCRAHDILLIADEVITGFGRTGAMWGAQRYGFTPDLITFAKVVTSGYQPLGGVLVGPKVAAPFWDGSAAGPMFAHGYTYSGHAAACAAAMANLDIIEGEGLVDRVAAMEGSFGAAIRRLEGVSLVGEVRTVGFTAAIAIAADRLAADPTIPARLVGAALRHGVATRVLRGHALQISPAFTITAEEVDVLVDGLGAALEDVAGAA
jgi:putrescine---pyruvate transaminase